MNRFWFNEPIMSLNPGGKGSGNNKGGSTDVRQVKSAPALTFDLHQHEVLIRHGAVVGHLLCDVDAAQTHAAEVFFAGQTCQSGLRVLGGLSHWNEKEEDALDKNNRSVKC